MCAKHIPNTLISDEYHMCVSLYVIRANSNLLNINYSGMLDTQEMCWGFFNLMSKVTGETEHLLYRCLRSSIERWHIESTKSIFLELIFDFLKSTLFLNLCNNNSGWCSTNLSYSCWRDCRGKIPQNHVNTSVSPFYRKLGGTDNNITVVHYRKNILKKF